MWRGMPSPKTVVIVSRAKKTSNRWLVLSVRTTHSTVFSLIAGDDLATILIPIASIIWRPSSLIRSGQTTRGSAWSFLVHRRTETEYINRTGSIATGIYLVRLCGRVLVISWLDSIATMALATH